MKENSFAIHTRKNGRVTAIEAYSSHSFARHTHEEFGIGLMVAGAQRSWSGRGRVEAGVGTIITVNPGEVHDGEPIGNGRAWRMLYVIPELVACYVQDIQEDGSIGFEFSDPAFSNPAVASRFAEAYRSMTDQSDQVDAIDTHLTLIFAGLLRPRHARPGTPQPNISVAKKRIDDDPAGQHSLKILAKIVGISKFQIIRSFAASTGLTPHAYVMQSRVDVARRLIRQRAPLADVAFATGFADQSHFNRAFIRRYGLTPGAYATAMR